MGNASFVSGNGAGAKGCIKEGILGVAYVSAIEATCLVELRGLIKDSAVLALNI